MSVYIDSFQFISLDGTRSAFDSSGRSKDVKWKNHIIPQGKQIRTVETLLDKSNGILCGFKWISDDGAVLVKVGCIDWSILRNLPFFVVTSLTLNHNQRLVGMKSYSWGQKYAAHY